MIALQALVVLSMETQQLAQMVERIPIPTLSSPKNSQREDDNNISILHHHHHHHYIGKKRSGHHRVKCGIGGWNVVYRYGGNNIPTQAIDCFMP